MTLFRRTRAELLAACLLCLVVARPLAGQEARWRELSQSLMQLYAQGRYTEAIPVADEALKVARATFGPNHVATAASMNNLAELYRALGRYNEAEPLYRDALAIWEEAGSPEQAHVAAALNNLALMDYDQGRYGDAEKLYRRALEIWKGTLAPDDRRLGLIRNNLGQVSYALGKYEDAEQFYRDALAIQEKAPGPEHPDEARSLSNLGALYTSLGRYADAERVLKRAVADWGTVSNSRDPDAAQAWLNMGVLYYAQEKYPDAEKLLRQALEMSESTLGDQHPYVALALNDLGEVLRSEGKYPEAERLLRHDLAIQEAALGKDSVAVATSRANLGALCYSEGRYAEAQEFLQHALAIHEKVLGNNHPAVERDLQNLAIVYYSQRMYADAMPLLNRDLQVLQGRFQEQFTYQTEGDRLQFLDSVAFGIPLYFSVCFNRWRQDPTLLGNMYDAALWEKGLIANSMAAIRARITASGDKEAQNLFEQLSSLRTQLAGLRNPPKTGLEQWQNTVEQLRQESAAVETNLVRRSSALAEERRLARATWQDVRNALKPGEAAIEFVRFDYHDGKQWTGNGYYVALVLTPEAAGPSLVPLGEARQLEGDTLQDYWRLVAEVPAEGAGMQFYRAFWKPLEPGLAGHRRVYVSTDGVLNAVSFAVLPTEDGHLLLDKFDIRDVFSTKDLLRPAGHSAEKSAVLLGNPKFDLQAGRPGAKLPNDGSSATPLVAEIARNAIPGSPQNSECPDLPPGGVLCPLKGTETEVRNIFALLKQANWDAKPPYTQESARKEVIQNVRHPRLLHVATHGFFSPESAHKLPDLAADLRFPMEDPMLRSGLMFAGADRALKGEALPNDADNGVLTASEVATLDLQGTELVVLSACETGRGRIENNGEGVFGLRRALQEAGSESVLMSMWKAPDLETRDLMTLFYQKWLSGEDKYDALHDAQTKMRDEIRARWDGDDRPYYWGAFVLVGR